MSPLARLHPTTEGRRGSRIDLEEGGAIWVSPEIAQSERSRVSKEPGAVQLPSAPPLSDGSLSGQAAKIRRVVIGRSLPDLCLICGEADPTVSYAYANHTVIRSTLPAMHSGARIAKRPPDGAPRRAVDGPRDYVRAP